MRLTTAEIKKLILECAQDGAAHKPKEFSDYINRRSERTFTKGQLAGAIAQLAATGELLNTERGVYLLGSRRTAEAGTSQRDEGSSAFAGEIRECLTETVRKLEDIVERTDVMNMSQAEFRLLGEIKNLKENLEGITVRY